MEFGDPADHLHDQDGLTNARSPEEANLATLHVRREEVDDFDARLEHGRVRLELVEGRCAAVNLPVVLNRTNVIRVERFADHVEHVAEDRIADRHGDAATGLAHDGATNEAVRRLHADATYAAFADLLGDLAGHGDGLAVDDDVDFNGVVDLGQRVRRELHVHDRSSDRDNASRFECGLFWSDGHLFLTFPSGALQRRPRFP